jgi:hypothetical protein
MTIDEWTTAYMTVFGPAQINKPLTPDEENFLLAAGKDLGLDSPNTLREISKALSLRRITRA